MAPDWNPRPLDVLLGYERGRKVKEDLPANVLDRPWHPEDAFEVRPNEFSHWCWLFQKQTKTGWRNLSKRIDVAMLKRSQMAVGDRYAALLIAKGLVDLSDIDPTEHDLAKEALGAAAAVMRADNADHKNTLAAARLILDFTRSKPVVKVAQTISTAESILDQLDED